MDSLAADAQINHYRHIVETVLSDYANFLGNDDQVQIELVFDRERDRYLLVETGWQENSCIYGTLLHIDIINGKFWIQQDGTEDGIANELVEQGIPKDCIVLGFKSVERRRLNEFAAS